MKRVISLFIAAVLCITGMTFSTTAYEEGDPCLTYGYDPAELDNYDTYGDDVFFRTNYELTTPQRIISVILTPYASKKIIQTAVEKSWNTTAEIVNESYFPEFSDNIAKVECSWNREDFFNSIKDIVLREDEDYYMYITIYFKEWSKEIIHDALVSLAPRADIDIYEVYYVSYSLEDVAIALKSAAGWDGYSYDDLRISALKNGTRFKYDLVMEDQDFDRITLADVSLILKAATGWDLVGLDD